MNAKIRQNIMEILDNNSEHIPDGVYLQLCNELQKFNFEKDVDDDDDGFHTDDTDELIARARRRYATIHIDSDSDSETDEVHNRTVARSVTRQNANRDIVVARQEVRETILNPATGRRVSIHGRVGRRLINSQTT